MYLMAGCKIRSVCLAWARPSTLMLDALAVHGRGLDALDLSGWGEAVTNDGSCQAALKDTFLTRLALCAIVKNATNIRILDLSDCYLLSSISLDALMECPNLIALSLSRCARISFPSLL